MKITALDKIFSDYIRERDNWTCQRCGKKYNKYNPHSRQGLHCSHYFGRTKKSTRFDPDNCDSLCMGCHGIWQNEDREGYRNFKIKQLGKDQFNMLTIKANTPTRINHQLIKIYLQKIMKKVGNHYELR